MWTDPAGQGAQRPRHDDDPDGLSFYTEKAPENASTVFGALNTDPLDRVFGENPLVSDEELGTASLAGMQEQVAAPRERSHEVHSEQWNREFILYGPPMANQLTTKSEASGRPHLWSRGAPSAGRP